VSALADILEQAVEQARADKEARAGRGVAMLPMGVTLFRGGVRVARLQPRQHVREALLRTALCAAAGFAADTLAVRFETWFSESETNPVTGQPWEDGQMQEAAERHDGVARGFVSDSIMVLAYNRAGDSRGQMLPFRIVGGAVVWGEPWVDASGDHWGGVMHEKLLRTMTAPDLPTLVNRALGAPPGLDAEGAVAFYDCLTAQNFTQGAHGSPVCSVNLYATRGSIRARFIRARMPHLLRLTP
jgi:hypothetical protein